MDFIANILIGSGTFGLAVYCYILAGRLKKFSTLESGMGGAIAVLSAQVDDMTKALEKARGAATGSAASLEGLATRSEAVATKLELLLASMHDLPEPRSEEDLSDINERKLKFVRRRGGRDALEATG